MIEHALLPEVLVSNITLRSEHDFWIKDWLSKTEDEIKNGVLSSSNCVAGYIAEHLVYGKNKTDWLELMKKYLEINGLPLAYSENYGRKLFKFNQWKQSPIHAIYARWWIENNLNKQNQKFQKLIMSFIQQNNWIYNPDVSPTNIKTRMRSELFMSLSMATEILVSENFQKINKNQLVASAISIPLTGYVSSEYFRFRTLNFLGEVDQMPKGIDIVLKKCRAEQGFADFSVEDKVDDYMGVAKRATRDKAVFSPISTLHAITLAKGCMLNNEEIESWKEKTKNFLEKDPVCIPALHMRDLKPNFGDGPTIYEIIASAKIMQSK